jgi:flagellar protein FlaI
MPKGEDLKDRIREKLKNKKKKEDEKKSTKPDKVKKSEKDSSSAKKEEKKETPESGEEKEPKKAMTAGVTERELDIPPEPPEDEEPPDEPPVEQPAAEPTPPKIPQRTRPALLSSYSYSSEGLPVEVRIARARDFVPKYELTIPGIAEGTKLILETKLKGELVTNVKLDISEILDPKKYDEVKSKFLDSAHNILKKSFPSLPPEKKDVLAVYLIQHTLGLGEIEPLLSDDMLEEITVNNAREPVWVYHKKFGWCKTNIHIKNEDMVYDYSSMIARKIGRQINVLNPMMDAHLPSGDRVNATLFPISNFGNTITIRKFSRNPWTIIRFLKSKTISSEVAALVWLCIQNELSLLVSGGTGSGKTSFLNAMAGLIPANQRIISIEDTRELTLPSFLQWVPMVVREPNPEGKGEVKMLDLMVNALRQRPDRILVGEIRRQREAEVMFEAMHTGHSVYATLHADNAEQTISRLTNPPINVPKEMLDALAGIVVTFRHRRFNIRRILEFSEVTRGGDEKTIYRWDVKNDKVKGIAKMDRLVELLSLYAGMDEKEIEEDVEEKMSILNWMEKNDYDGVDEVGEIIAQYYLDPASVLDAVKNDRKWNFKR